MEKAVVFALLCVCFWPWSVCAQGADDVRFTLNNVTYQNNSLVNLEDIGEGNNELWCITDNTACCSRSESPGGVVLGDWVFPNGTVVPNEIITVDGLRWDFYRLRGPSRVRLLRRRDGVDGIYRCDIPDTSAAFQTIYIGIYSASTGQLSIPGEMTFQLDTDPATDPPVFTLTCTSTGGPATTVSWRRGGTMLSDNSTYSISSQVTDAVTATYTHTLTVTGRLVGEYQCSVSNIRTPSGSTRSLTVGADPPTDLSATQVGPTSIRVSWTAPVSGATVTGYRISYSGGTDQGSVDVGASATDHTITINPPQSPLNYSISIMTLSSSFPSSMVGPVMVTIGVPDPPTGLSATQVGPTRIRVSWTAPVSRATVTGYRISYSGGTNQSSVDVGASATDYTITIPQPLSRLIYSISITTLSFSFQSSMAGPIMVTADIPPTITTATPGVSTATSAVISWNQQAYVNIYEMSLERATGNQQFGECPAYEHRGRVLVGGTTTTHNLTGLQEFSTYFITVTAVNAAGRNESLPVTVNTLMTAPSDGPLLLGTAETTSTSVVVVWGTVKCIDRNSNITGYMVRYTPNSSSGTNDVMVAGTGESGGRLTIDELAPSTQYTIQVAAVSIDGAVGQFSAISVQTITETNGQGVGSFAGGIVGVCIGTALLYTAILLVVILLVYCINKRRKTGKCDTQVLKNLECSPSSDIETKECVAYEGIRVHSEAEYDTITN